MNDAMPRQPKPHALPDPSSLPSLAFGLGSGRLARCRPCSVTFAVVRTRPPIGSIARTMSDRKDTPDGTCPSCARSVDAQATAEFLASLEAEMERLRPANRDDGDNPSATA